jgi:hypothetical protein
MAERPNKRSRKKALGQWKAVQRSTARAALPLPDERMKALFDVLDTELSIRGCDHTLRLTRGWLAAEGLPAEPVIEWLRANGGYCDCEASANAEDAWLATGRRE